MSEAKIPHPQRPRAAPRTKRGHRVGFAKRDVRLLPAELRGFYGHRERLRRCLIFAGAENLPDTEILEVILFTANPRADAEALAAVGLGPPAIAGVKLVREAALRLMRAELLERPVIGSWDKLVDFCTAQIGYSKVEELHLLFLDRKNVLIKHERQQRGTVNHTPVYTREVVKRALELGASALIMVHNHPSGDPTPSQADISVTKDIVKAAAPLGITLHDHIIIGRGRHTSLRDLDLI